jgi:hypothetical protein
MKIKKFYDSTNASTRVIVSFITEQLHRLRNVRSVDRLSFYERMLADIVGLTISSLNTVQFACVFLSIARQLEHYHLDHLFPLPLQTESEVKYITVEDLFNSSVMKKSLPVASSSLPIFENTDKLHEYCLDLLHHCITSIFDFVSEDEFASLWCIREEFVFIQQIFNYTVKLEDSFEAQQYHYEDSTQEYDDSVDSYNDVSGIEHSYFSDQSYGETSELIDDSEMESFEEIESIVEHPSRIKRLTNALTPSFLKRSNIQKNDDEKAIALAASTFVKSGFHDDSFDSSIRHNKETGMSTTSSLLYDDSILFEEPAKVNVSELIGKAIVSCFFRTGIKKNVNFGLGLKQIAVLSILLQSQNNDRDFELYSALDLIQSVPESDCHVVLRLFKTSLETHCKDVDAEQDQNYDTVTAFSILTQLCVDNWSFEDAKAIYGLMLSVLARYKNICGDDSLLPVLAIITIISCHASCQLGELFRESAIDECAFGVLFQRALNL